MNNNLKTLTINDVGGDYLSVYDFIQNPQRCDVMEIDLGEIPPNFSLNFLTGWVRDVKITSAMHVHPGTVAEIQYRNPDFFIWSE